MDTRIADGETRGFMNPTQIFGIAAEGRRATVAPPLSREPLRNSSFDRSIGGSNAPKLYEDDCGFDSLDRRVLAFKTSLCPQSHRKYPKDLTPGEWEHIEDCQDCRNALASLQESAEPRLRKLYRHLRLTLHDWNPLLQFFTLLLILAVIGWGIHQVRVLARTANTVLAASHARSAPPSATVFASAPAFPPHVVPTDAPATKEQLAKQLPKTLNWPWSSCAMSADVVNSWLGLGTKRRQIEKDFEIVERTIPKKGPLRREAARPWCDALGEGSGALARDVRREADRIQSRKPESKDRQ
jgi:hypothetical protein